MDQEQQLAHYEDHVAFFYGKISAIIASLITYFLTENLVFIGITIAMIVIMVADVRNIRSHKALMEGNSSDFETWSRHYAVLSTAFMLAIGIWSFCCFALSDDTFLHLLCVATTMGNLLNLICRNFANDRSLTIQIVAIGIPLILGVLNYGDFRSMILCGFLLPLFFSIRDISQRLRNLFDNVLKQSQEKEEFGIQLNEALESMSHGLMMFDEDMRLRVLNATARHILAIPKEVDCYSRKLSDIVRAIEMKKLPINRVRILERALTRRLQHRSQGKIFQISDRQHVELSIKLRDTGGCVLVLEDVSQRITYQERINQLARFDDLTGLCNRAYFIQRAEEILDTMGRGQKGAMFFFDLDDFKRVNDMLGHEAGDYILSTVGERLTNMLPKTAAIGRYGGDEYVLFMNEEDCDEPFEVLGQRILKEITQPLEYNNQMLRYGASMGIALCPDHGMSMERLLKLSDLALYEAKNAGKNLVHLFSPELENSLTEKIELEEELTLAVKNQSLELHFQPIISMEDGRPQVFEALTRWNRSDAVQVSPALFIPLAEELGLIREIGEWTLYEACRRCMDWPAGTSVAVNVSAVQFQVGSITEAVRHALDVTGLEPNRLEIEITETAVLNDMVHAIRVLEEISEMGVRISLDDFGTGYSSLSYLHKLPLDKLKIDKAFVDDLENSARSRTLLKGITALGRALELKVVVEGIENENQFILLRDQYPVDYVQGYFFSKALPADLALQYVEGFHHDNNFNESIPDQQDLASSRSEDAKVA
ncbi:MAG: EAL domain-containing protein [Pseudomonadota bacterium]